MRRTFDLKIYFYFISPFLVGQFTLFLWEVKKLCSHIIDNFLFKNFNLSQARLITLLNHFNFFFSPQIANSTISFVKRNGMRYFTLQNSLELLLKNDIITHVSLSFLFRKLFFYSFLIFFLSKNTTKSGMKNKFQK